MWLSNLSNHNAGLGINLFFFCHQLKAHKDFMDRVKAVAFTDSVHSLDHQGVNKVQREWMEKVTGQAIQACFLSFIYWQLCELMLVARLYSIQETGCHLIILWTPLYSHSLMISVNRSQQVWCTCLIIAKPPVANMGGGRRKGQPADLQRRVTHAHIAYMKLKYHYMYFCVLKCLLKENSLCQILQTPWKCQEYS